MNVMVYDPYLSLERIESLDSVLKINLFGYDYLTCSELPDVIDYLFIMLIYLVTPGKVYFLTFYKNYQFQLMKKHTTLVLVELYF